MTDHRDYGDENTRPLAVGDVSLPAELREMVCAECGVALMQINRIAAANDVPRAWWVTDRVLCTQCAPTYEPAMPAELCGVDATTLSIARDLHARHDTWQLALGYAGTYADKGRVERERDEAVAALAEARAAVAQALDKLTRMTAARDFVLEVASDQRGKYTMERTRADGLEAELAEARARIGGLEAATREAIAVVLEVRNSSEIGSEYTVEDNSRRHYRWLIRRCNSALVTMRAALEGRDRPAGGEGG